MFMKSAGDNLSHLSHFVIDLTLCDEDEGEGEGEDEDEEPLVAKPEKAAKEFDIVDLTVDDGLMEAPISTSMVTPVSGIARFFSPARSTSELKKRKEVEPSAAVPLAIDSVEEMNISDVKVSIKKPRTNRKTSLQRIDNVSTKSNQRPPPSSGVKASKQRDESEAALAPGHTRNTRRPEEELVNVSQSQVNRRDVSWPSSNESSTSELSLAVADALSLLRAINSVEVADTPSLLGECQALLLTSGRSVPAIFVDGLLESWLQSTGDAAEEQEGGRASSLKMEAIALAVSYMHSSHRTHGTLRLWKPGVDLTLQVLRAVQSRAVSEGLIDRGTGGECGILVAELASFRFAEELKGAVTTEKAACLSKLSSLATDCLKQLQDAGTRSCARSLDVNRRVVTLLAELLSLLTSKENSGGGTAAGAVLLRELTESCASIHYGPPATQKSG